MSMSGEGARPQFRPAAQPQSGKRDGHRPESQSQIRPAGNPFAPAPKAAGALPGLAGFAAAMPGLAGAAPRQPARSAPAGPAPSSTEVAARPAPRVLSRDRSDPPPAPPRPATSFEGREGAARADDQWQAAAKNAPADSLFAEEEGFEGPSGEGETHEPVRHLQDLDSSLPDELQRFLIAGDEDEEEDRGEVRQAGAPLHSDDHRHGSQDASFETPDEDQELFSRYDEGGGEGGAPAFAERAPGERSSDMGQAATRPAVEGEVDDVMAGDVPPGFETRSAGFDPAPFADVDFGIEERGADDIYDLGGGRGVQPFEARYDQHPEIPIGAFNPRSDEEGGDQPFFHQGDGDADFLDQGLQPHGGADTPRRGRKTLMVTSALVGALALGGALAYAYKTGSDSLVGSGEPPVIQADQRPVKAPPAEPGGKEFPNKNKLIYDRLQGEERAETERLVPRQEEVAQRPDGRATDGSQVALATPPAAGGQTSSEVETAAPRRVRTFVVRPDGTVVQPETDSAPAPQPAASAAPAVPGMSVVLPGAQQAGPQAPAVRQSAAQPPAAEQAPADAAPPTPTAAPAPPSQPQVAARTPARSEPTTAAAPRQQAAPAQQSAGTYVVQVAARKSQTDALAAFADLQQRYPSLLSGYRPIIERADLGDKGVWYRLRVGPMETRTVAASLCDKLKAAGMSSCLVYAQ